jgi:heat shock protein HslJ
MKRISLIYVLFFLVPLFNCFLTEPEENELEEKKLQNIRWILESFDIDGNIVTPPKDQAYTIQFKEDSTVSGKIDCNYFYAKYLITSDNSLRLEQFMVTEIGCGGDQSISDKYVQAVREAKSYEIHKNRLYIYYGDNSKLIFYSE